MTRPIPEYTVAELERLNAVEFPSLTNDEAVNLGLVAQCTSASCRYWRNSVTSRLAAGSPTWMSTTTR